MSEKDIFTQLEVWLKEGENLRPDYEGTLVDNHPRGYWMGKRSMCFLTLKKLQELKGQSKEGPIPTQSLVELLDSIAKALNTNKEDTVYLFGLFEKLVPMFGQITGLINDQQKQLQYLQNQINVLCKATGIIIIAKD